MQYPCKYPSTYTGGPWVVKTRNDYANIAAAAARVKAGASEKPCIMCLGDSIVAGRTVTNDTCFPGIIRDWLGSAFGDVGKGGRGSLYLYEGEFYHYTGTWTRVWGECVGFASCAYSTSSSGAAVAFEFAGEGVDLYFGGGLMDCDASMSFEIDGDEAGTLNLASVADGAKTYTHSINGLVPGPHMAQITRTSGTLIFVGWAPAKGVSGIVVHNCGVPSSTTAMWAQETALCTIDMLAPKLTIIESAFNDWRLGITRTAYQANLTAIANRALQHGDVLMLAAGLHGQYTPQETPDGTIFDFRDAMEDVAVNLGVGFVDGLTRWREDYDWAYNNGLVTDAVHPSAAGQYDYARMLAQEIF